MKFQDKFCDRHDIIDIIDKRKFSDLCLCDLSSFLAIFEISCMYFDYRLFVVLKNGQCELQSVRWTISLFYFLGQLLFFLSFLSFPYLSFNKISLFE